MRLIKTFLKVIILILLFYSSHAFSNTLDRIKIIGNERISDETIKLFINVDISEVIDDNKLNNILKDLYETDFFKDINLSFNNQILTINVIENPIIENIFYKGIKADKILNIIKDNSYIKSRSSYNEKLLKKEKLKILNILKNLGFIDQI